MTTPKHRTKPIQSTHRINDAIFKIPSKQPRAIPIVAPTLPHDSTTLDLRATPRHSDVVPPPATHNLASPLIDKLSSNSTNNGSLPSLGQIRDHPVTQSEAANCTQLTPHKDDQNVFDETKLSLDIFAPNYVPRWLQAVNESITDIQPCPQFPIMDFAAYVATIAGPAFVRKLPLASIPPLSGSPLPGQPLIPHNYLEYWLKHLQSEFSLQYQQYQTFTLYNQTLQSTSEDDCMYMLHIPGLRENTPRIDIGDTIQIRLLQAQSEPEDVQVRHWLMHGKHYGAICPGFSGLSFNPQVHQMNRTKETIVLKMDRLPNVAKCNILFPLQESKREPLFRAVQRAVSGNKWLIKMLFPSIEAGTIQTTLSPGNFDIPWVDDLNWQQKKAIHSVLAANYGTLPYLISGPPGTGKTKTLVELALQLLHEPGHLLLCAPSDAAADTLALRLSAHLEPNELFRLNSWTRTFAEVPDRLLLYTYSNDSSFSLPPIERMLNFRIVVTTCRDADLLNHARLDNTALDGLFNGVKRLICPDSSPHPLHWKALLLDEAAQATEPDALIPLTVVMPAHEKHCPQFIAAGDEFQLGPKLLSRSNLSISLFQRLFATEPYLDHPLSRKHGTRPLTHSMLPIMRPAFTNLIRNYRSHGAILSVPSSLFYKDTLITECKSSPEILGWSGWRPKEPWPILFKQNASPDMYESITKGDGAGNGTLCNPGEARVALDVATSLLRHANQTGHNRLEQNDVMIMSPFTAQVSVLRKTFRNSKLHEVNIGPLEAFQGLESRIVIICTTRTRTGSSTQSQDHYVKVDKSRGLGMIDEAQRFNVAMTRAKEGLIIIGNAHCLVSTMDRQWISLLDFCKRNQCYSLPPNYEWPDLNGPHKQGQLERALIYEALARIDTEQNIVDSIRSPSTKKLNSGFKLRGSQIEMDEEMWQSKELANIGDREDIDPYFNYPKSISENTEAEVTTQCIESENNGRDGYDRDVDQEIQDECKTQ